MGEHEFHPGTALDSNDLAQPLAQIKLKIMFDLDTSIRSWRKTLELNPAFVSEDIDELEQHVRDEVHAHKVKGLPEEDAYRRVLENFGTYGAVENAYQSVYWSKARRTGGLGQAMGIRLKMWSTYGKLAYRSLVKDKLSTTINILGFGTAISCCILVFVYLHQASNLDTFHAEVDRIFQVQQVLSEPSSDKLRLGKTPVPLGPILALDYPSVELAVRVERERATVKTDGSLFDEFVWFVDPDFLNLFTFPLLYGDKDALSDPQQIILSQRLAEKYFGNANPVGQSVTITLDEANEGEFIVGGVAAPFPNDRALMFNLLIPYKQQRTLRGLPQDDWAVPTAATFIRISDVRELPNLASQLQPFIELRQASIDVEEDGALTTSGFWFENLTEIGKNEEDVASAFMGGSSLGESIFMVILALIILLLASTNYVNIAIVSASRRIKEIGIRKVVGGTRRQLVIQFVMENVVLCAVAMVFGIFLAYTVLLPGFNDLFPPHAPVFEMDLAGNGLLWVFLTLLLLFLAAVSGLYPALYVAKFEPVVIMQGREKFGRRNLVLRGLLVFQFVFTFIALVMPIADSRHNQKLSDRDWGYDPTDLVVVPVHNAASGRVLFDALAGDSGVEAVAGSRHHIGARQGTAELTVDGMDHRVLFFDVGENYAEVMDLELLEGRFLSRPGDSGIVVNLAFVAKMGWTEGIGQEIVFGDQTHQVVGVTDNFLRRRWADEEPHFLRLASSDSFRYLVARTHPRATNQVARNIRSEWLELNPGLTYAGFHQSEVFEDNDPNPLGFIGFLALLLSCAGNLGLVALHVTRRRKEISIRKVMGATSPRIIGLVLSSFARQAVLSLAIAVPISYLLLGKMIDEDVMRFDMSSVPFLMAAGLMLGLMFVTLSVQLLKAASTDPAESLRAD